MNKQKGNGTNSREAQQMKSGGNKPTSPTKNNQTVRRRTDATVQQPNSVQPRPQPSRNVEQMKSGALGKQQSKGKPQKRKLLLKSSKSNKLKKQPQKPVQQPAHNKQTVPQKPQTPPKPIDKKTRKAAEKAMNTRHTTQNTRKFKGGNYILYYLLFAVVAVIVLVILANTVLFNCTEIIVNGASRYQADVIIDASPIRKGDNLLHIDKKKAAEEIATELVYVEKAEVTLSFPTKVVINVVEAERWYCISEHGVNALVSRGGKILEKGNYADVPVVVGYGAQSFETGSRLQSKDEAKQSMPADLMSMAEKVGIEDIDSIDITDRYAIMMNVDGRIQLELGSMANIESKFIIAKELIDNEISPTEGVKIILTNPEKVAVQTLIYDEPVQTPDSNADNSDSSDNSADSNASDNGEMPENSSNSP